MHDPSLLAEVNGHWTHIHRSNSQSISSSTYIDDLCSYSSSHAPRASFPTISHLGWPMLPVSSSLKASECSPSPCFLELDRRNGNMDSTLRLMPRKVSADTERTIILAVIFGILGSIAIVFVIYYIGRYYLLRQSRLSSTDMIIERPIDISSPLSPQKRDYLSSPMSPPKPSKPPPRLPETETTAFILDHPYAQPYVVRDGTSMAIPQSTIGTSSNASVRSMPHPYSSRLRQDQHHPKSDRSQHTNTTNTNSMQTQTHATAPTTTTDESQQYESFMTPDTPRSLSFKELSLSLASPDTTESGLNSTAATAAATQAGPTLPPSTERSDRTGAAATTTTSPFKVTYPPSAYTHDTVQSEDTLPSMYSYTSTSGPIPIQELHFAQASPSQPRTHFR